MGRRLFWVDDNAIHNGPDKEGYWLIDGSGYEATEVQAIADAQRCEHGKIDQHKTAPRGWTWVDEDGVPETEWCVGAPELMALLDALNEEDSDE